MTNKRKCSFLKSESGTISIIFALILPVLVAIVGAAVDYGRYTSARARTLQAMDTAVLAAGRVLQIENGDEAKALAAAERYYHENKSNMLSNDNVTFSIEDGEITVSITDSRVRTPFLGVIGIGEMKIRNVSKAIIAAGSNSGSHVEIAMMLDVMGSICGSYPYNCTSATKLDAMKAAAKDLIDIVVWEDQSLYSSRIALVLFSEHVNVGTEYFSAITGTSPEGNDDERTCVRARDNANRYEAAKPNGSKGHCTHFPQSSGTCRPTATLMPLSANKDALKAHVDAFAGRGSTAGHLGTQFAWYTLDPDWGSIWGNQSKGLPYSMTTEVNQHGKPRLYKIAVLMTDGEYNKQYSGDGSTTQAREFCTAMKNQGIVIYTVGFEIGTSGSAYDTMQQCASSSDHFYNASNGDELRMSFRDIAMQVSTLRLAE